jgi:type 2 lantibiotic biosynthesis protein LanM
MSRSEDLQLLRFYWNLTPAGAAPLMRSLTSELNRAGLPFSFKVVNAPSGFTRCDAGVLYVRKSDYEAVSGIVRLIYPKIADNLNQRVPAFTKRLAPGLGLAEDPGRKLDSFGLHRCRLLAEGLIRASRQRNDSLPHRLQVVWDHFARNGISLEKPFLSSGSKDVYHFELPKAQPAGSAPAAPTPDLPDHDPQIYLETAAQIGSRLTRQAIWHEGRCNWLGFLPIERSLTPKSNATFSALGSDLYSGTSGLALFLAELHRATGNAEARRTALGAIRQALSRVDALPLPARAGLFSGWIGIALVAARVGKVLQQEDLLRAALRLARRCTREKLENWEFDLFYGKAGTIAGLVLLSDLLDEPALLEACVPLARKLLRAADKSEAGHSWQSSAMPSSRNLTGFSHGAAGIGYALLELFHSTRDLKYRRAAEAVFRYERHWYDPHLQNWPDLREEPHQARVSRPPFPFATAWCHGAPGITLSRLRAFEILEDNEYKAEALAGLETTRRAVEFSLHSAKGNYSLCHGVAGNAEVLLHGSRSLGPEAGEAQEAAEAVAANGIKRYRDGGNQWPCGTSGGETPGLMLGLAGIGYFYLRRSTPSVPSILILRREEFSPV